MQMYDLPVPILSESFLCCNFMHYLFRKAFCNILIQKFQNCSHQTGCLALYTSLFQKDYWCQKLYFFVFVACYKHTTFQIIYKRQHYVKSVRIRSYSGLHFSRIFRIRAE